MNQLASSLATATTNAMRRLIALSAAAASISCSIPLLTGGPDCIDETRGFSVEATLSTPGVSASESDSGFAHLSLSEARNARSKRTSAQELTWHVRANRLQRSTVTGVHVHAREGNQLLITIPRDTLDSPANVITNTYTRRAHPGSPLPWVQLYELIGSGGAYLDVHSAGSVAPVLRGDLTQPPQLPPDRDWRAFFHAYCS
jgi:hypothetical protein